MKIPNIKFSEEKEKTPAPPTRWTLVAKTFIEPKNVTYQDNPELSKIALTGQTVFLFQSEDGTEFRQEVCEGLENTALDRLLDKVDATGPEIIVRGDKRYVLARHADPMQVKK